MGSDRIIPFPGERTGAGPAPDHFRPDERRAWDDIVHALAPLHLLEVDKSFLELAAATLASYRNYCHLLDDMTRARHTAILREVLEEAFVSPSAIPALLSPPTAD